MVRKSTARFTQWYAEIDMHFSWHRTDKNLIKVTRHLEEKTTKRNRIFPPFLKNFKLKLKLHWWQSIIYYLMQFFFTKSSQNFNCSGLTKKILIKYFTIEGFYNLMPIVDYKKSIKIIIIKYRLIIILNITKPFRLI